MRISNKNIGRKKTLWLGSVSFHSESFLSEIYQIMNSNGHLSWMTVTFWTVLLD